jgi:hypothetical protein
MLCKSLAATVSLHAGMGSFDFAQDDRFVWPHGHSGEISFRTMRFEQG